MVPVLSFEGISGIFGVVNTKSSPGKYGGEVMTKWGICFLTEWMKMTIFSHLVFSTGYEDTSKSTK